MLAENETSPNRISILKELLGLIEEIRYRRYQQWRNRPHPLGRTFTQLELRRDILKTYGNLLAGTSNRIPTRQQILDVAEYLECTSQERNELLLCARYLPIVTHLSANEHRLALGLAESVLALVPLPAFVSYRDWSIHRTNIYYDRLYGLPPLETLSGTQRSALGRAFDPELPVREHYSTSHENWARIMAHYIHSFKEQYKWERYDSWYTDLQAQLDHLPDFGAMWRDERQGAPERIAVVQGQAHSIGRMLRYIHARISFGFAMFPAVVTVVPVDEATRDHFVSLGCNLHDNQWLSILQAGNLHWK